MTIAAGDRLPDVEFTVRDRDGTSKIRLHDIIKGKKVVIIGMPGAFTPTCHLNHLPGFLEHHDSIRARGVDEILLVSVNDHHVMHEWAKATQAEGKIRFLGDMSIEFTRAIGMDADMSAGGLGVRSKRYSMIVEDCVVTAFFPETERAGVTQSGAAHILTQL